VRTPPRAFRAGIWLAAVGYALWFATVILGKILASPHTAHLPEYSVYSARWPETLVVALTVVEFLIVIGPMARRERWAQFAAIFPVLAVGLPRLFDDPRCFASITSQHGCHMFLASMILIAAGLLFCAPVFFSRQR
jgi:hypothetical protein